MANKVLILAYEFPPHNSIAAHRPHSWFKFLGEFSWHPVVVTRHWDQGISDPVGFAVPSSIRNIQEYRENDSTAIRVPFHPGLRDRVILRYGLERRKLLRKALTAFHSVFDYLTLGTDTKAGIYRAARKYCLENDVAAIVATGEPFILFRYAWLLHKEFGIPWIADYRDGWSTNHMDANRNLLTRTLYRKLEIKWTATAAMRTTASPTYSTRLKKGTFPGRVQVITNGYDPELIPRPQSAPEAGYFTIGYAGTLYSYQPLEEFFEAMKDAAIARPATRFKVVFFGAKFYPDQEERIRKAAHGCDCELVITNRLAHKEVLFEMSRCNALLLLSNPEVTTLPAKVFDYLALQKPIINHRDDNSVIKDILVSGKAQTGTNNTKQLVARITDLVDQPNAVINYEHMQFSRKSKCRELAEIISKITAD